ncbi:MAG TPA: hypothetical protein VG097_13985 [Gemmata sp.]|jgi:hypothetical protein|nr:hypothetical protein [Gemmata sp.]
MIVREWTISKPYPHLVRVEHAHVLSGKAKILVDGEWIYQRGSTLWDMGFEHRFELDGLPCIVRVLYRTWHYEYELWIDGKLQ